MVTILSFGAWGVLTLVIHGDAINGKIENGKFYVAMKGMYTEVPWEVYLYSLVHTCTNFVLFPATIISGFLGLRATIRKPGQDVIANSREDRCHVLR